MIHSATQRKKIKAELLTAGATSALFRTVSFIDLARDETEVAIVKMGSVNIGNGCFSEEAARICAPIWAVAKKYRLILG